VVDSSNPLISNDSPTIRGWTLVIFAAVLLVLVFPAIWLVRNFGMLPALAAFFAAALLAVLIAVAPMGGHALPALGLRAVGWQPIVLGTVVTTALSVAVSQLGVEPQGIKQAMDIAREPSLFMASLVALAVLAPLVEELIFRGLLYGWLASRWGTIVAWIVSSLAFAAAHVELAHVLLVLPLGLWFGWLRRRTDSLWPSLVAHMFNNGLAVAAAVLLNV
jgi:membrane protease YdiL (CAAX protease family)